MDVDWKNFQRREKARLEREFHESAKAMKAERDRAERELLAPQLAALNPVRLLVVYRKTATGFRAEAVGYPNSCESSTRKGARDGLIRLVRDRARILPGELLKAVHEEASAEEVTVDLSPRQPSRRARSNSRIADLGSKEP